MAHRIEAIIWDFGNVLGRFNHMKACRGLAAFSDLSPEEIYEKLVSGPDAPETLHEEGLRMPAEFFLDAREAARLSDALAYEGFCPLWGNIFTENKGIEKVLEKVRSDIKMCVCSNTDPIHWQWIKELPVMREYFSDQNMFIRSYLVTYSKPSEMIYRAALQQLHISCDETHKVLYIDDVLNFCRAFRQMGGNALQYHCGHMSLNMLEAGLEKYGVLQQN